MFGKVAAAAVAMGLLAGPTAAQQIFGVPWIPPELLDTTRKLDEDTLTFCLNTHSAMVEFDREVAQAIADALLLNAEFHDLDYPTEPHKYDFRLPHSEAQLFLAITNHCDALMGFRLVPNSIPDWLTVSRPYFESKVVFATAEENVTSFAQFPAGERIGVRLGATGHRELRTYLQALPEGIRPRQIPYPDNELLIERLRDGTLRSIMIWEYAPYLATEGEPAALGIRAMFEAPFPVPVLQFAVAMLEKDAFVRGLVDAAIEALDAGGVLDEIAARHLPPVQNPA